MSNDELRDSAAKRLGVSAENGNLQFDRKSLLAGMGGWLGVIETILPSVLFGSSLSLIHI